MEEVNSWVLRVADLVNNLPQGIWFLIVLAGLIIGLLLLVRLLIPSSGIAITDTEVVTNADVIKKELEPSESSESIAADEPNNLDKQETQSVSQTTLISVGVDLKQTKLEITSGTQKLDVEDRKIVNLEEKLSSRLSKTSGGFLEKFKGLFSRSQNLHRDELEELEALLISSDLGVATVNRLLDSVRSFISERNEINRDQLLELIKSELIYELYFEDIEALAGNLEGIEKGLRVVMIVGVNGVGKTTTVAKLASKWSASGHKVLLAAADTFRAAAVEQLCHWGQEIGVEVVSGAENAKPGSVVFDAVDKAVNEKFDILLIDTAGRLHTKSNLMQELEGVRNVISRKIPDAPHETWLVLDGSTGQNALMQANEFNKAVSLTGTIVTKLDGTSKGGIVVAIRNELGLPVRFIGVGESKENLRVFNASNFVEALFDFSQADSDSLQTSEEPRRRRRRQA